MENIFLYFLVFISSFVTPFFFLADYSCLLLTLSPVHTLLHLSCTHTHSLSSFFYTTVSPGTPFQAAIAILISVTYTCLVLKTAPFEEDSDDVIAFVTEVQLAFTFFVGFALLTDNKETPFFNADVMDVLLVVVNCFGFVTLIMGNCYQQECHNCTKHKERIEAVIEMHEQRKISKLKPRETRVSTIEELAKYLENDDRDGDKEKEEKKKEEVVDEEEEEEADDKLVVITI